MINLVRTCLYIVASLTLAATCAAQGRRTRPANREQAPTRVERSIVIGPETRVVENRSETSKLGQATVSYDPDLKSTSISVMLQEVYRRGEVTANLEFSFGFKGREPVKEGEVHWAFISDWDIFRSGAPLTVTADGRRHSFKVERDFSLAGQHVGRMDFASFRRLANSKQARLSVGRVSFVLTESQREALRDMLKVFETTAKKN